MGCILEFGFNSKDLWKAKEENFRLNKREFSLLRTPANALKMYLKAVASGNVIAFRCLRNRMYFTRQKTFLILWTFIPFFLFCFEFSGHCITQNLASHCAPRLLCCFLEKIQAFFRSLRFFGLDTEVLSLEPEFPEKFAGFTETAQFFILSWAFASRAKHSCAARIGRTAFADAGFKLMVRAADPEISPVFFPGLLYNVECSLSWFSTFSDILFIFCCKLGIHDISPVNKKL